jgi:hypothetical protein
MLTVAYCYSFGSFGLLNLFGLRREVQAVLTLLIFIIFCYLAGRGRIRIGVRNPVFILTGLTMVLVSIHKFEPTNTLSFLSSLVLMLMIGSLHIADKQRLIRWMAYAGGVFALLGFIGMAYLMTHPELRGIKAGYDSGMLAEKVEVLHPIMYLGFFDSLRNTLILGRWVPRMYSYAPEPSALICTLMMPATMGIVLGGKARLLGLLGLAFCLGPVQSGIIWLVVLSGIAVLGLMWTTRAVMGWEMRHAGALAVVIASVLTTAFVLSTDMRDFTWELGGRLARWDNVSTEMSTKQQSAFERLSSMQDGMQFILRHPLGTTEDFHSVSGPFLIDYGVLGGVLGSVIAMLLMAAVADRCLRPRQMLLPRIPRVATLLMAGACIIAEVFSGYGWNNSAGLVVLYLMTALSDCITSDHARSIKSVAGVAPT